MRATAMPEAEIIRKVFPTATDFKQVGHTGNDGDWLVYLPDRAVVADIRTCPGKAFCLQVVEDRDKDTPGWATAVDALPHVLIVRAQPNVLAVFDAAKLRTCTRQHLKEWTRIYPLFGQPHSYNGVTWTARYLTVPVRTVIDTLTLEYGTGPSMAGLPVGMVMPR